MRVAAHGPEGHSQRVLLLLWLGIAAWAAVLATPRTLAWSCRTAAIQRRATAASAGRQGLEPRVVIAGLGPGDPKRITQEVWEHINASSQVYARIRKHPALEYFPPSVTVHTFDSFYDDATSFESLYSDIADSVLRLAQEQGSLLYVVPGDPYVGESTTRLIVKRGHEQGVVVEVLPGVSFVEPTLAAVGEDMLPRLIVGDAHELMSLHHLPFEPNSPMIISQLENQVDASVLKLLLMTAFPSEHRVALVHAAGSPDSLVEWTRLREIDRSRFLSVMTSLFVPARTQGKTFAGLRDAVAARRSELGEEWDMASHRALAESLRDAAQEVIDCCGRNRNEGLVRKLAAVFTLGAAQLQLAEEEEAFDAGEVFDDAAALARGMTLLEDSSGRLAVRLHK